MIVRCHGRSLVETLIAVAMGSLLIMMGYTFLGDVHARYQRKQIQSDHYYSLWLAQHVIRRFIRESGTAYCGSWQSHLEQVSSGKSEWGASVQVITPDSAFWPAALNKQGKAQAVNDQALRVVLATSYRLPMPVDKDVARLTLAAQAKFKVGDDVVVDSCQLAWQTPVKKVWTSRGKTVLEVGASPVVFASPVWITRLQPVILYIGKVDAKTHALYLYQAGRRHELIPGVQGWGLRENKTGSWLRVTLYAGEAKQTFWQGLP